MATRQIPELTEDRKKRFWISVNKDGPIIRAELGPCWIWMAGVNKKGYGRTGIGHATKFSCHRISWVIAHGEPPDNLHVLHKCDNPTCVNPSHLFLGTNAQNTEDCVSKGRHLSPMRKQSARRGERHYSTYAPEKICRGENHGMAKLKLEEVLSIKSLLSSGCSRSMLAAWFCVGKTQIDRIATGNRWAHI